MVIIIARRTFKAEFYDEILDLYMNVVVPGSRQEPGCISYELYEDCNEPYTIATVEEWESDANQSQHEATEHYKKLREMLTINTQRSSDVRVLRKLTRAEKGEQGEKLP